MAGGVVRKSCVPQYEVRKMEEKDVFVGLDCGDSTLNEYLLNDAWNFQLSKLAVTYVVVFEDRPDKVVAFCPLANDKVSMDDFGNKTEFNRFRRQRGFSQKKRLTSYPAVKVCRLGVDLSARGLSVGSAILDFMKTMVLWKSQSGCRFLTVDAYHSAVPFYQRNGFKFLDDEEMEFRRTRSLYFDLNDILD